MARIESVFVAIALAACGGSSSAPPASPPPASPPGAPAAEPAPEVAPLSDRVDALVRPLVRGEWLTGVSIGLVDDGEAHSFHYGVAREGAAPTDRTIYEIGSISKVFTALALADMVVDGAVTLDTEVEALLPDGVEVVEDDGSAITLEHLATHTSGLPRLPTNHAPADEGDPYADYTIEQLHEAVGAERLAWKPGARTMYSNLGFGLLGYALSRQQGTEWAELIRTRVTGPLGLDDTVVSLTEEQRARFARGTTADGEPTPPWILPQAMAGAGALRSTTADMIAFARANMQLEPEALAEAMTLAREPRRELSGGAGSIALGWHVGDDGHVWHNGGTGGFRSFVGFDPHTDRAVVVLSSTASPKVDAVANALFGVLEGASPTLDLPEIVELTPETLQRYAGDYSVPLAGLDLAITVEDGALHVQPTDQPRFRLYPTSETRFRLRAAEAVITFTVEDGEVTGLVLEQGNAKMKGTPVE